MTSRAVAALALFAFVNSVPISNEAVGCSTLMVFIMVGLSVDVTSASFLGFLVDEVSGTFLLGFLSSLGSSALILGGFHRFIFSIGFGCSFWRVRVFGEYRDLGFPLVGVVETSGVSIEDDVSSETPGVSVEDDVGSETSGVIVEGDMSSVETPGTAPGDDGTPMVRYRFLLCLLPCLLDGSPCLSAL